jgi:hypothetical protein
MRSAVFARLRNPSEAVQPLPADNIAKTKRPHSKSAHSFWHMIKAAVDRVRQLPQVAGVVERARPDLCRNAEAGHVVVDQSTGVVKSDLARVAGAGSRAQRSSDSSTSCCSE